MRTSSILLYIHTYSCPTIADKALPPPMRQRHDAVLLLVRGRGEWSHRSPLKVTENQKNNIKFTLQVVLHHLQHAQHFVLIALFLAF
ncbi:hypothetical protein [Massilia sp. PWRC2]|uniref:hypothetical protein n=1 Tax=Massilia sp. PWRC2 TaxID=2804626 RepID=UPI003CF7C08A